MPCPSPAASYAPAGARQVGPPAGGGCRLRATAWQGKPPGGRRGRRPWRVLQAGSRGWCGLGDKGCVQAVGSPTASHVLGRHEHAFTRRAATGTARPNAASRALHRPPTHPRRRAVPADFLPRPLPMPAGFLPATSSLSRRSCSCTARGQARQHAERCQLAGRAPFHRLFPAPAS